MSWPRWSEAVLALVVVSVVLGIGFLAGGGGHSGSGTPQGQLTVTASGSAWVKPDEAQIGVGAQETADTAPAALQKLSTVAGGMLKALRAYGVQAADIQTSNLNLNQSYGPNGQLQGYQAQEQFTITTRDLRQLGAVVTAATAAGANQLNGLTLTTADPNAGQQQAVQAALKAAGAQARAEAAELGVTLGGVRTVHLVNTATPLPIAFSVDHAAAAQAAPIATGNQQVQVSVQVTYSFR